AGRNDPAWIPGRSTRSTDFLREGVRNADGTVHTLRLEVLGQQLAETVILRIRPHVSVEPLQSVGGGATKRGPDDRVVGPEHRELSEHLLRLAAGVVLREQWSAVGQRSRHGGDELDDRLVRDPNGVIGD